ncbi:MAG: DoxX family protein [Acidobacteria bacterium]|nr:MAG: DoxX family protein [Acidobacteriota bacterium]REK09602.1 MAG: DoxX family protein [Acidobacteriota bacterium]
MNTPTIPSNSSFAITVLRAALGALFLAHGLIKLLVYTPAGTAAFFDSVGMPTFLAAPTIGVEIVGGLLLLSGLFTRWAALAVVPIVLGATTVHWGNGFTFSNAGGGWEFTAFLAVVAFALFLDGRDGAFALGSVWSRRSETAAPARRVVA